MNAKKIDIEYRTENKEYLRVLENNTGFLGFFFVTVYSSFT